MTNTYFPSTVPLRATMPVPDISGVLDSPTTNTDELGLWHWLLSGRLGS